MAYFNYKSNLAYFNYKSNFAYERMSSKQIFILKLHALN